MLDAAVSWAHARPWTAARHVRMMDRRADTLYHQALDLRASGILVASMATLVGCFSLDLPPGKLQCDPSASPACPAGLVCRGRGGAAYCYPPGFELGDGSPRETAAGPDLGPPVDPTTPFSAPVAAVRLNSDGNEDDPTLTANMLEILFERNEDIWRATRTEPAAPWSAPAKVPALNSGDQETNPELTADGLTIFLGSKRWYQSKTGSGDRDVFQSTRAEGGSWTPPVPVVALNSDADDGGAVLAAGAALLFFPTNRDNETYKIFASTQEGPGTWNAPEVVELGASSADKSPWVNAAATVLYFASERPGGKGGLDIWVATRESSGALFGPPVLMENLASEKHEEDPWLSEDLGTIYFESDRDGDRDIYSATR